MAWQSAYRFGKFTPVIVVSLVLAALSLSGCDMTERIHDTMDQQAETTKQSLENVTSQGESKRYNPLVVTNKIWAGDSAVRIQRGIPLPPKYETPRGFTLVAADPMTLADIATAISTQTGIPVHVEAENNAANAAQRAGQTANASFAAAQMMRGGFNTQTPTTGPNAPAMSVAYEGPLSGLLDHVSGYFGVAWRYDGGTVEISHFETRTFTIEALPGTQKLSADLTGGATSGSSGSGGGSSGGGSSSSSSSSSSGSGSSGAGGAATSSATMELKADVDVKYWEELKEILTSMLNGEGTVVLSPSLGTITVTTTPDIMHSVAGYITQENERMSRQIAIDVEVYTLGLEHGMDFNLSFTAFLKKMGNFGPISLADQTGTIPTSIDDLAGGLVTGNVAILNQATGHNSISDIFTALSSISNTTRQAQFPLITLNNRPVSVRVGEDQQYVCGYNSNTQATASTASSSNVIVTPTVCTLNLGFSIQLAPRLLDDGRILLQYALTSNDLVGTPTLFNSVCGSGTDANSCAAAGNGVSSGSVELVNTNTRSFSQQSVLRSGSTLVIGGVNEKSLGQNAQGVGSPYNFIFGGGVSNDQTDTMILIAITPQVIDLPRAEHG